MGSQMINVGLERRFGISRAGNEDACRLTEGPATRRKNSVSSGGLPPASQPSRDDAAAAVRCANSRAPPTPRFRRFGTLLPPGDRFIRARGEVDSFQISCGNWDAEYVGFLASRRFANTRKHMHRGRLGRARIEAQHFALGPASSRTLRLKGTTLGAVLHLQLSVV